MFRFYKLYSLYVNSMASAFTGPREWCLCEKLPRAMLHIPVEPQSMRCEVCGLARRPRDQTKGSSSDDEPPRAVVAGRKTANPSKNVPKAKDVRLKVAVKAQKPKKSKTNCPANCVKCDSSGVGGEVTAAPEDKDKVYFGRHGLYKKPKKKNGRRQLLDRRQKNEPSAPPPSSPSPPPPPSQSESPHEDMPALVIMAHEVFNRPYHLRRRCSGGYRNLLVSDFIPLNSPITDRSGGAISKRSDVSSVNSSSTHSSAPLPPLSKVLANILAKNHTVTVREKGGGLVPPKPRDSLDSDRELATQFSPFDSYEGPSEDALVVDSARQMLHRPMSLYPQPRTDLLNNDVEAADFDRRSGYGSTPMSSPRKKSASDHVKSFSDTNVLSIFGDANRIQSSSSSKNSSVSSGSSPPSILPKSLKFCEVGDDIDDKNNSDKLPTDSSNTFVSFMDKIFWASKSQNDNSDEEEFQSMDPEQVDELNDWMRNLSHDDHGISSARNPLDISSNKTESDAEYSKCVSVQEGKASGEGDSMGSSSSRNKGSIISVMESGKKTSKSENNGSDNSPTTISSELSMDMDPYFIGGSSEDLAQRILNRLMITEQIENESMQKLASIRKDIVEYKLLEPDDGPSMTPPKIKPSEKPAEQKKPKFQSKIPTHSAPGRRQICKVQYNPSAAKKCQLHGNISKEVPNTKVSKHEMIQKSSNTEKKCTSKTVLPKTPGPADKSNGDIRKTYDGMGSQDAE
ncbi:uncharacterized protein [Drosophila bipectinata]|uniref:uncharacterized protein n=1 Tax=Drosophila bipectinata TaxID=42026 RepID=UPI0038B388D1